MKVPCHFPFNTKKLHGVPDKKPCLNKYYLKHCPYLYVVNVGATKKVDINWFLTTCTYVVNYIWI